MNSVIADLQSAAWDRDVKLVLDASTELNASFDPEILQRGLGSLLALLIREAARDATISVVTAFEAGAVDGEDSHVKIEITTSATAPINEAADPVRQFVGAVECCLGKASIDRAGSATTFMARLPGQRSAAKGESRRTAIVVDDDVDMQDFLGAVLRREGFNVVAVNDGFDALIVIERYDPDVILTDIMMPNMNGIDLVSRIKQARADLPVIVFSGYHETLQRQAREQGLKADYILPKPMTQKEVVTALANVLKERA